MGVYRNIYRRRKIAGQGTVFDGSSYIAAQVGAGYGRLALPTTAITISYWIQLPSGPVTGTYLELTGANGASGNRMWRCVPSAARRPSMGNLQLDTGDTGGVNGVSNIGAATWAFVVHRWSEGDGNILNDKFNMTGHLESKVTAVTGSNFNYAAFDGLKINFGAGRSGSSTPSSPDESTLWDVRIFDVFLDFHDMAKLVTGDFDGRQPVMAMPLDGNYGQRDIYGRGITIDEIRKSVV